MAKFVAQCFVHTLHYFVTLFELCFYAKSLRMFAHVPFTTYVYKVSLCCFTSKFDTNVHMSIKNPMQYLHIPASLQASSQVLHAFVLQIFFAALFYKRLYNSPRSNTSLHMSSAALCTLLFIQLVNATLSHTTHTQFCKQKPIQLVVQFLHGVDCELLYTSP